MRAGARPAPKATSVFFLVHVNVDSRKGAVAPQDGHDVVGAEHAVEHLQAFLFADGVDEAVFRRVFRFGRCVANRRQPVERERRWSIPAPQRAGGQTVMPDESRPPLRCVPTGSGPRTRSSTACVKSSRNSSAQASSEAGLASNTRSGGQYRSICVRRRPDPSRAASASMVSVWPGGSLRTVAKNVRIPPNSRPARRQVTVTSSSAFETPGAARTASTALARTNRSPCRA